MISIKGAYKRKHPITIMISMDLSMNMGTEHKKIMDLLENGILF